MIELISIASAVIIWQGTYMDDLTTVNLRTVQTTSGEVVVEEQSKNDALGNPVWVEPREEDMAGKYALKETIKSLLKQGK